MADKRRKRPMMATTASHCDTTSRDFHVVSIGDATTQAPRRRSASAGRSESWMTKVTSAMSHRIFSGRRLSSSRSTQVMPMLHGQDANSSVLSDDGSTDKVPLRTRGEMLRLVSSEATLPRPSCGPQDEPQTLESTECPTVVCDIDPDALCDEMEITGGNTSLKCSVSTIHVSSPQKSRHQSQGTVEKVHPRSSHDDEDQATTDSRRRRQQSLFESTPRDSEPLVQDAAPILKDFFSRSATKTQQERAQQRESRREKHYENIKLRHERLRVKCDQDQQTQEHEVQREKIDRLRKLNQQRRQQLMKEASLLKRMVDKEGLSAQSRFQTERERWENAFEDEIRTLGKAYRKASSKLSGEERPMTVAGLAVPEALTQIQREASSHERRLKTAAPAGWSSVRPTGLGHEKEWKVNEPNILHVENSPEVFEVFGEEEVDSLSMPERALTMDELLAERQLMLKQIVELEQQLREARLCVVVESGKVDACQRGEGFFI